MQYIVKSETFGGMQFLLWNKMSPCFVPVAEQQTLIAVQPDWYDNFIGREPEEVFECLVSGTFIDWRNTWKQDLVVGCDELW